MERTKLCSEDDVVSGEQAWEVSNREELDHVSIEDVMKEIIDECWCPHFWMYLNAECPWSIILHACEVRSHFIFLLSLAKKGY